MPKVKKTETVTETKTRKSAVKKSVEPVQEKVLFNKGSFYVIKTALYVRKDPSGVKKKMYELPVYLKMNSHEDSFGDAMINVDTKVECLDVVNEGKLTWMIIPGGVICVTDLKGNSYVEEV